MYNAQAPRQRGLGVGRLLNPISFHDYVSTASSLTQFVEPPRNPGRLTDSFLRLIRQRLSVDQQTEPELPKCRAEVDPDLEAIVGSTIGLDAGASYDPEGALLTFSWSQPIYPAGNGPTLDNPSTPTPSLTLHDVGVFQVFLDVTDEYPRHAGEITEQGTPRYDSAVLTVTATNTAPLADAGADRSLPVLHTAVLDASASSDPDGHTLASYQWSVLNAPAGSSAAIVDVTLALASFTPDLLGDYVILESA